MSIERKTIKNTFPSLVQYFLNPQEAEMALSRKTKVKVKCPCCLKIHEVSIRTIALRENTFCQKCCDTYSYPERLMASVFDVLGVEYILQFHAKWAKLYRYDFEFEKGRRKYIVEMDGGIGHGHNKGQKTPEESLRIDIEKDLLAEKHGYEVIRIDCEYGNKNRFDFIRNNILNSKLAELFELLEINWEDCNKNALSSKTMRILELYRNNTPFLEDIAKIMHISVSTVKSTLIEARKNGLIDNVSLIQSNPLKNCPVKVVMDLKYQVSKTCAVYCYEDAIAFGSTFDADVYYGYPKYTVRNSLNSYDGSHKGRHFVKYADLPSDFDFKPKFFSLDKYRTHAYCQWSSDERLVNIFENKNTLPKEFRYLAINRVTRGIYSKAYGYGWTILPKDIEFQWLKIPPEKRSESLLQIEKILKERGCA